MKDISVFFFLANSIASAAYTVHSRTVL